VQHKKKVSSVQHKKVCMKEKKASAYEKSMKEESNKEVIQNKNEKGDCKVIQPNSNTKDLKFACIGTGVEVKEQGREVSAPTEQQNIHQGSCPEGNKEEDQGKQS
jgi:hypothetical protein